MKKTLQFLLGFALYVLGGYVYFFVGTELLKASPADVLGFAVFWPFSLAVLVAAVLTYCLIVFVYKPVIAWLIALL